MNTTKGGSQQGQIKLDVIPEGQPGDGYYNGVTADDYFEKETVHNIETVDSTKNEKTPDDFTLDSIASQKLHQGVQVNPTNQGRFGITTEEIKTKEKMTTVTEDTKDETIKETAENGSMGVGVSQKDIKDWQSTLTEKEITEGFEDYFNSEGGSGGRYDDKYNYESSLSGAGVESEGRKNDKKNDKYDKQLDKNNNVGYDTVLDTMAIGGDMDSDNNENGKRLSSGSDERPIAEDSIKTMDTLLRKNGEESLPESGEINSPEDNLQNSHEIAELETKKKVLLGKVEKARLILDELLADREGLANKTQFLGIGEESASSLAEEIEVKEVEIDDLQKQISEVDRQLEIINHTEEQAGVVEDKKLAEKEEMIKGDDGITEKSEKNEERIGLNDGLEGGLSNSVIEDGLVDKIVDDKADDSIEILPDGSLVGVIKDGQTVSDVIEGLILKLNESEDRQEAKSMGMIAFGNFRLKFLNMSVDKGMTKEEAISSWKNLLATLVPGDKIVIRLSDQGVELDIPVISGHTINTDKIIEDGVADDYNLARVA